MKYTIFVEKIFDDVKFNLLKEFIKKHDVNLFCITPVNYYLAVGEQGYKGTKKEFSRILLERYKELEALGCEINLHLHLAMNPESCDQEKMFKESVRWLRNNGFAPYLWTAGWYIYDDESLALAEHYGLSFFNDRFNFSLHDYELEANRSIFKPMMILQNIRGLFR